MLCLASVCVDVRVCCCSGAEFVVGREGRGHAAARAGVWRRAAFHHGADDWYLYIKAASRTHCSDQSDGVCVRVCACVCVRVYACVYVCRVD